MKYSILGFKQDKLMEFGLDIKDAAILRYFVDFMETLKMRSEIIDKEMYYWVKYEGIINQYPILKLNNVDSVYRRFKKLVQLNILKHKTIINNGKYSYYTLGDSYGELLYQYKVKEDSKNNEGLEFFSQEQVNQCEANQFEDFYVDFGVEQFEEVSRTEVLNKYDKLNEHKKLNSYEELSVHGKLSVHKELNNREKLNVYEELNRHEEINGYNELNNHGKLNVYKELNSLEEINIYKELNNYEQQDNYEQWESYEEWDSYEEYEKLKALVDSDAFGGFNTFDGFGIDQEAVNVEYSVSNNFCNTEELNISESDKTEYYNQEFRHSKIEACDAGFEKTKEIDENHNLSDITSEYDSKLMEMLKHKDLYKLPEKTDDFDYFNVAENIRALGIENKTEKRYSEDLEMYEEEELKQDEMLDGIKLIADTSVLENFDFEEKIKLLREASKDEEAKDKAPKVAGNLGSLIEEYMSKFSKQIERAKELEENSPCDGLLSINHQEEYPTEIGCIVGTNDYSNNKSFNNYNKLNKNNNSNNNNKVSNGNTDKYIDKDKNDEGNKNIKNKSKMSISNKSNKSNNNNKDDNKNKGDKNINKNYKDSINKEKNTNKNYKVINNEENNINSESNENKINKAKVNKDSKDNNSENNSMSNSNNSNKNNNMSTNNNINKSNNISTNNKSNKSNNMSTNNKNNQSNANANSDNKNNININYNGDNKNNINIINSSNNKKFNLNSIRLHNINIYKNRDKQFNKSIDIYKKKDRHFNKRNIDYFSTGMVNYLIKDELLKADGYF